MTSENKARLRSVSIEIEQLRQYMIRCRVSELAEWPCTLRDIKAEVDKVISSESAAEKGQ